MDSVGASVGASVVDGAGASVVVSEVGAGAPGGNVAAGMTRQLMFLSRHSTSYVLAHIAEAAFVTTTSYSGGQLPFVQSRMEKNQSGTAHRQLKSMAAQAYCPALFNASV